MKLLLILGLLLFPCAANAAVEMVTFPNMVTPQPVASVAALPAGEALALDFVTSAPTAQQVKMPANGEFEVKVQAGPQFAVLDNDATDGLAVVQMPAQMVDIYLRPEGTAGTLHLEDPLYYHHQRLAVLPQQAWYHLPGRPLPVPTDWYSPHGQHYILKLTNQGMPVLKTRWQQAQQKSFPVGMKEIGPEGGIVELPGIGSFNLLAGALIQPTLIVMRQEKNLPRPIYPMRSLEGSTKEIDFISPVLKIEPVGLKLHAPGNVNLTTDLERLGVNSAGVLEYLYTIEPKTAALWDFRYSQLPARKEDYDNYPTNLPAITDVLGYFVRIIDKSIKPTDGGFTIPPSENDFQINSIYDNVMVSHGYRSKPCLVASPDNTATKSS